MAAMVGALGSEPSSGRPVGAAAAATNLPAPVASFIGRVDDLDRVDRLLAERRIVTLTGTGGCGKTRIAIQVARNRVDDRHDAVWFVDLARHNVPESALSGVADVVGPSRPAAGTVDTVVRSIGERTVLLVLDNCEHLPIFAAQLADELLGRCPALTILATSREPLGLPGETTYQVPPLAVPDGGGVGAAAALRFDAIELFVDRARRARPDFPFADADAPIAIAICRALDGLPLGIELAAARVRALELSQILDGLHDRFRLLTGGARTGDPRHRTLRASIEWSYDLLDDAERTVLDRLSVFVGGFTLAAAGGVCATGDLTAADVPDIILQLVDRSLVDAHGGRFSLLETIREYTAMRLADAGATEETRARHYAYFCEAVRQPADGASEIRYRGTVDEDYENIRRALQWAAGQDDPALLARMASRLHIYWVTGRHMDDGARWLERVIEREGDPRRRAKALNRLAGMLWMGVGELARAQEACDEALAILREAGDKDALGEALLSIPLSAQRAAHFDEAVALLTETGSPLRSWALHVRGFWTMSFDPAAAGELFEEAIDLAREIGPTWAERIARARLALQRVAVGEVASALPAIEDAAGELRSAGEGVVLPDVLSVLAALRQVAGDASGADAAIDELEALLEAGDAARTSHYLADARLSVAMLRGQWSDAVGFLDERAALAWPGAEDDARRLGQLALIEALTGRHADAVRHAEQAAERLPAGRTPGAQLMVHLAFLPTAVPLALAARGTGDLPRAEELAHAAVAELQGHPRPAFTRVLALVSLASIWARRDRHDDAARLFAGARAEAARVGMASENAVLRATEDGQVDAARHALGPEGFAEVWAEGAAMSWDEVVGYAQRGWGPRRRPAYGWESLTPTEQQVADLVAGGATNKEVAAKLVMSVPTVKSHLTHVYAKLGITNRAQLAAEAARRRG